MSYARFAEDSSVYVFLNVSGYFECCSCGLSEGDSEMFETTDALLAHLRKHHDAGHDVPERTFARLEAEREENDAWLAVSGASRDSDLPKETNDG